MNNRQWNIPAPPWVFNTDSTTVDREVDYAISVEGVRVIRLSGESMVTKACLLNDFADAFNFYQPWGNNWDAFEEVMFSNIQQARRATILVISAPETLLIHEEHRDGELAILLDILQSLGAELGEDSQETSGAVSFHVFISGTAGTPLPPPLSKLPGL